ncbi:hypothetical protein [Pantoea sp. AG702]|uniref:hypothetical protein n=1 Tax=Pantoea sp. AG702 TaxID=2183907 RepID=UPI000D716035|nr:hypothetical protein [Pantoea sp. AG702]PWW13652.1 hypothetical protein DFO57_106246 [Pantoea sp. AG702]
MSLLELLVKELPKLGGWPGDRTVASNGINGTVVFHSKGRAPFLMGGLNFSGIGCVSYEEYEAALAASKQPEWNGEGLPLVGTKCDWQDKNTKAWLPVIIVYASEWVTVIREGDKSDAVEIAIENYGDEARRQFRPTLNEMDIKREEAIAAMRNFATNYNNTAVIHAIEKVYDSIAAGKIPHITLK